MKLVLVRHGRPDEGDPLRPHDPGLRADGRRQAEEIVHFQPGYGSVSRLRVAHGPRRIGIVSINESAHHLPVSANLAEFASP